LKLKKIEINGFKSFADKTLMQFHDGITCIVGPNGCGKSNVVDVTKWILGEQSVKSLRGKEMTDVIFNGTATRKALGFAEASMVVSNDDRLLPYDMDEVKVTRRVHRTGEGEYFINQRPARLKDVKELFMDTGVGTKSYSVMEQGQIESFINATSKDRRKLFEEAAGISRYKAKKEEATRKLEKVEQNLLRINDVIDELEKRLKSVTLQAQKARRYQSLVDELKKYRVSHSVLFIDEINSKRSKIDEEIAKYENQISELNAKLANYDAETTQYSKDQVDIEHQIQIAESQRASFRAYMAEMDTNQAWSRRNIQDLVAENKLLQEEVDGSNARTHKQADQIISIEKELHGLDEKIELQGKETIQLEDNRNELQESIKGLIESVDEKKQVILQRVNEKIRLESECAGLKAQVEMLQRRREELTESHNVLAKNQDEVNARCLSVEQQVKGKQENKVTVGEVLDSFKKKLLHTEDRVYAIEKEISSTNQKGAAKDSRLQILQDLESRNEGLSGGVKAVLDALKGNSNIGNIHGIIADLFTVDQEFAVAIEIFLGFRAQEVVTATAQDAKKAIEFLKVNKKGRCTFLPLDRIQARRPVDDKYRYKKGVLGLASDLITFDPIYKNIMSRLLGHVFIVDTIDNALEISKDKDLKEFLVTLDGEVFSPDGAISGGTKREAAGIVTRKNEILVLTKELDEIRDRITTLAQDYNQIKDLRRSVTSDIDKKSAEFQEINIGLSRLNAELQEILREKEKAARSAEENAGALSRLVETNDKSTSRVEEIIKQLSVFSAYGTSIEEGISELEKGLREKERVLSGLNNSVTTAKMELASVRDKKHRLEGERELIKRNVDEQRDRVSRDEYKLEENNRRKSELEKKIIATEAELHEYLLKNSVQEGELKKFINKREETREMLKKSFEEAEGFRKEERKYSDELNAQKMKLYEVDMNATKIKDKIWEEYRINIDEFLQQITPEEKIEIQATDFSQLSEFIDATEKKIKNIGPVNVDAIQEQEALDERFNFLTRQRNDLVNGKNSLSDVIEEINAVSRELFVKTFEEVRIAFQDMFRRLFGGGRADIVIQEGVDVLEAGIEIFAKPPGKENRSITLLSGGEKVMTTIALLFAVFKTKPSPFCILDEIDAALDEANVDRFMAVLQEFLSFTQFVIITHNPRTMSMSDEIYGVTMEEKGVSKAFTMKVEALAK
jgi:chromosome segregation protein